MKAAIYTTDYLADETPCVIAHDPILHEAFRKHYNDTNPNGIDYCFTWGSGQHEAAWMLEDMRKIRVADMVARSIPVPEGYEEYVGYYDWSKPAKPAPRTWWRKWLRQLNFDLRRLPYAIRDARERRMLRRLAR